MTAEALMVFGGPHAGEWFPLDDDAGSTIRLAFTDEQLAIDYDLDPAKTVAPEIPYPHRYDLVRFGFKDRCGDRSTFACWVHHPEHDELAGEIEATLKVIAWLARWPVWRPSTVDA